MSLAATARQLRKLFSMPALHAATATVPALLRMLLLCHTSSLYMHGCSRPSPLGCGAKRIAHPMMMATALMQHIAQQARHAVRCEDVRLFDGAHLHLPWWTLARPRTAAAHQQGGHTQPKANNTHSQRAAVAGVAAAGVGPRSNSSERRDVSGGSSSPLLLRRTDPGACRQT